MKLYTFHIIALILQHQEAIIMRGVIEVAMNMTDLIESKEEAVRSFPILVSRKHEDLIDTDDPKAEKGRGQETEQSYHTERVGQDQEKEEQGQGQGQETDVDQDQSHMIDKEQVHEIETDGQDQDQEHGVVTVISVMLTLHQTVTNIIAQRVDSQEKRKRRDASQDQEKGRGDITTVMMRLIITTTRNTRREI